MNEIITAAKAHYNRANLILMLFIAGFLGYLIEVTACSYRAKKLVNRGFLHLPIVPIYAFGLLLCHAFLQPILAFPLAVAALTAIITGALEYITGLFMEKFFLKRWWDYSQRRFNLHGRICLKNCLIFGALGAAGLYILLPKLNQIIDILPVWLVWALNVLLLSAYIFDTVYTAITVKKKHRYSLSEAELAEFNGYAEEIINHPAYKETKQLLQHGNTSVYEHSMSVAMMSFKFAKALNIKVDFRAIVRASLLHDFCGYDWHIKEGRPKWHGYKHPKIAYINALKYFPLSKTEREIIVKHMWPLTLPLPFHRESYIVSTSDKICAAIETIRKKREKRHKKVDDLTELP